MFQPDKKNIIIAVTVFLVAVLAIGAFGWYYYGASGPLPPAGNTLSENNPLENSGIEIETGSRGGLHICADKCGDCVCQQVDLECAKDSTNCVCQEDSNECPEDCI